MKATVPSVCFISYKPLPGEGGGRLRILLFAAFFFWLAPAYAQAADTSARTGPPPLLIPDGVQFYSELAGPSEAKGRDAKWWIQWFWNGSTGTVGIFGIDHIPVPCSNIVARHVGWKVRCTDSDRESTSSIWFIAERGHEIKPQSWEGFQLLGFATTKAVDGGGWFAARSPRDRQSPNQDKPLGNAGPTKVMSMEE